MLRMAFLRCSLGMPLNPLFRKNLDEFDIAPGGALPSISCPIAASIAADAWALIKISTLAKGKTILWAWMSRGFLTPETAAEWHFGGNLEELEDHMKMVKGAYRDLLSMKQLPSLDQRNPTEVQTLDRAMKIGTQGSLCPFFTRIYVFLGLRWISFIALSMVFAVHRILDSRKFWFFSGLSHLIERVLERMKSS